MTPQETYQRALRRARRVMERNGKVIARRELKRMLLRIAEDLLRAGSSEVVSTASRAQRLRSQVVEILGHLEEAVGAGTARLLKMTVDDVVGLHASALTQLGVSGNLSNVNLLVMSTYRAGGSPASTFRTLYNRHLMEAVPIVDDVLERALVQGASSRRVTEALARVLLGHPDFSGGLAGDLRKLKLSDLRELGVGPTNQAGLRTLYYDARRIAVSTINNGYREANRLSMLLSPVVQAARWTLSGSHHIPCRCEDLAVESSVGLPPGFFTPEDWPDAPHPFCACYAGEVLTYPPSVWR